MNGKTAVVTGAASGIGRETAKRFAEAGANVIVANLDEGSGAETVDQIESAGGEATFLGVDVSDSDDTAEMIETTLDIYGSLDFAHNNGGAIVNTSSIAGLSAAGGAAYVATKHGVIGLTRVAASEYAEEEIRVNAVCPGVIDTEMVDRAGEADPEELQQFVQMQPLGRKGQPEEIANAVVWLCSGEASFVTGSAYPVNGGYMAL